MVHLTMKPPPNLVILCPDELRADCLGFMGNPDLKTPHIDDLAAESAIFPRHVSNFPKCVPARISMMTGRYSHADGIRTIFQRMRRGTPNLLSRLREAGYQTALFGKNHCWDPADREALFDFSSKVPPYGDEMMAVPAVRPDVPTAHGKRALSLSSGYDYLGTASRHAGDELFTAHAIDFLRSRRVPGRPFYLQVNLESPHPKYGVEEPWFSQYDRDLIHPWPHDLPQRGPRFLTVQREVRTSPQPDESALREIQAVYYGMIAKVDRQIGTILAALKAEGLWENTVIVFLSDHGDYAGQYGLVEKWDTSMADCLVRTPLTIRAPGLPTGSVIETMSDHTNLAPTLLELLDLDPLPGMHSPSLVPVMDGGAPIPVVFSEGGHERSMRERFDPRKSSPAALSDPKLPLDEKQEVYRRFPDSMARTSMARSEFHKIVVRENGENEYYDLRKDPWELQNSWEEAAGSAPCQELLNALSQWHLRTGFEGRREDFFGA